MLEFHVIMTQLTRRQLLKRIGLVAAIPVIETAGIYAYISGVDGLKEDYRYSTEIKKEDYLLADSHAHFERPKNIDEIDSLLNYITSNNVLFQSISAILKGRGCWTYEEFRQDVTAFCSINKNYSIIMSDEYATVISSKGRQVAYVRSQELSCLSPRKKEIHLCIEGMPYLDDFSLKPEDAIETTLVNGGTVMLNHPYSVPNKIVRYWLADSNYEDYLRSLMHFDDLFVEVFNSMNVLHMAASNGKAESLAKEFNKTMIASTDCHRSNLELTLRQLTNAGFYVEDDVDFTSMTGKEIIALKKELAKKSPGLLRRYCPLDVFFKVMF